MQNYCRWQCPDPFVNCIDYICIFTNVVFGTAVIGNYISNNFLFPDIVDKLKVPMASVIMKFFIASLFMWITPIALLYGFNHNLIPGSTHMNPHSLTLLSGFLAVISVNVVIAFYIIMALKEPSSKHEPDAAFLAEAKASINQPIGEAVDPSQANNKKEE